MKFITLKYTVYAIILSYLFFGADFLWWRRPIYCRNLSTTSLARNERPRSFSVVDAWTSTLLWASLSSTLALLTSDHTLYSVYLWRGWVIMFAARFTSIFLLLNINNIMQSRPQSSLHKENVARSWQFIIRGRFMIWRTHAYILCLNIMQTDVDRKTLPPLLTLFSINQGLFTLETWCERNRVVYMHACMCVCIYIYIYIYINIGSMVQFH